MVRGGSLSQDGKRLLLLSLVFPPDAVSTAQLFGEVVEDLVALGWHVDVVTTRPHYNPPEGDSPSQPLTPLWGGLLAKSGFHGATVWHTAMPMKVSNVALRISGWLGFHFLSLVAAWFKVGKIDVILAPSPPLTIGLAAWLIGLSKRAPFIYNVQELYPDTAVSLGALRDGMLLDQLRGMERFVYNRSFAVTTIGAGMARNIRERTVDQRKVRLIPNFVDTQIITPGLRENAFSREYGLNGRFTVVYAGNMGPAQDLETLLAAAELTRSDDGIVYVFVGDGTSRHSLQQLTRSSNLSNVIFVPQQPYQRVPDIYASSDLCVVPLASSLVAEAVPSKIYRIMAAERRVLAIADPHSDLADLVRESGAGIVVEPGNPRALADAITAATKAPDAVPNYGRQYVVDHVDRPKIIMEYSDLLTEAVSVAGRKR
jgi:colanic acid biosynthesis glycosyl transferase WcaI